MFFGDILMFLSATASMAAQFWPQCTDTVRLPEKEGAISHSSTVCACNSGQSLATYS